MPGDTTAAVLDAGEDRPGVTGNVRQPIWRTLFGGLAPSQRRWLVAILVVAGVARLAWALYATQAPIELESGDAYSYYLYGQQFAAGDDLRNYISGEPTAYYPIGYPAMLADLFWGVQHTPIPDNLPLAATVLNVVLGTLSVALVFVIGRRIFATNVGLVAAGITAVFPNLVFYTASIQLETAFIFLALAAVAVVVTHDWTGSPPSVTRLVGFGALLGASALVRPLSLPFLAGLLLAALVAGYGWRRALAGLGWAAVPMVVLFAPWTIRNAVVMDSPIVFSTNMGDTLCLDRSLDAAGHFRWADHEYCAPPDTPEVPRNSKNTRLAIEFVRDHPGKELELIGRRAWYMMKHDHDGLGAVETGRSLLGSRLRTGLSWSADWFFYATVALGAAGLPAFFRGRRPQRLFVIVALLTLVVLPLGLWGNPRFHVPALPLIAVAAAVPLVCLWSRRTPRPVVEHDRETSVPAAVGA